MVKVVCLGHVDDGPQLLLEGVTEVAGDARHFSFHDARQEVRQTMVCVLQVVQLVRDPCRDQHALFLVRVYHIRDQGVACAHKR